MSKRKAIAVAILIALIVLIGEMIAFFTDTDTATNIITLGDAVEISLSETWTPADGLGIHPGTTITKEPSIHNDSTTTPAYVFAEIVIPCYDSNDDSTVDAPLFTFTPNTGWYLVDTSAIDTTNKTIKYVYAYGTSSTMTTLAASTSTSTAVFSSVTLEPTLTVAQKDTASSTPNIVITACGIQTDNVGTTPSAVWANFGSGSGSGGSGGGSGSGS